MFHAADAQPRHGSRIITVQPKPQTFKLNVLSLPILNAEEYAPHPRLAALSPFDTLLVTEDLDVVEAITGIERRNKYRILTKSGNQLYEVNEGKRVKRRLASAASWR